MKTCKDCKFWQYYLTQCIPVEIRTDHGRCEAILPGIYGVEYNRTIDSLEGATKKKKVALVTNQDFYCKFFIRKKKD
jgi:hypothetical protein